MSDLETSASLEQALLTLDRVEVHRIFEGLKHRDLSEVAQSIVVPALESIGRGWEQGIVALSQVYMSGRICEDQVSQASPAPVGFNDPQPRIGIAVLCDHHSLGKQIVLSILRSAGIPVVDLGVGMSPEALALKVRAKGVQILLISVLMLPSALKVPEVRRHLSEGSTPVRIVVGGAPFLLDPPLGVEVGADAVGRGASDAVGLVRALIEELQCPEK